MSQDDEGDQETDDGDQAEGAEIWKELKLLLYFSKRELIENCSAHSVPRLG